MKRITKQRAERLDYQKLEPRNLLAAIQIIGAGVTNQETIQLQIDGNTVRTFNNLGGDAYGGSFVTLSHSVAGNVDADQIRVRFTNDLYDPANNIDRNVRVDAIVIDGTRFETEDPAVFSTGTWKPEDGVAPGNRESEFLHSNGYFQYAGQSGSTTIEIVARGDEGNENLDLRIGGESVFTTSVGTSFQTYTHQTNDAVRPDQVQVFFTNDAYEPTQNIDRNLIVDYIEIDGTRYETEAPNVYSTGTWKPEDGIAPGFRESEVLHSNGYFQYGQAGNPGVINLESSVINVAETDSAAQFVIVRNNGSDGVVTVDYNTISISATPGQDYVSASGTVTFQNGQTSQTISVPLLDDAIVEGNEQFSFVIDNVTGGATLLAPRTATATIDDNDSILAAGDGLLGEYFDSTGFINRFQNRVDATVDFDWGLESPMNGMGVDTFSVRWSGQVEPRFSENYTFSTTSDDGVRLWVDNELVIDQWIDQPPTVHSGTVSLQAGQLYDIRMEYYENAGGATAQLSWSSRSQSNEIVPQSQLYAADPPPPQPGDELVTQNLITGLVQPTAIDFSPDGTKMYIAEQRGVVRVVDNGNLQGSFFLDFRGRVNGTRDRGLLDIAVHPDFENNPYVYLLYTYDPPQVNNHAAGTLQGPDGNGNRAGRLTRVTADASTGYTSIVPGSEVVLVGGNSTWNNFNAFANSTFDFDEPPAGILPDGSNLNDFIATDSESHTIGSVEFGPDGALYVSIGDGTSYNRVDPRTERVQDIDNLSGKILRIDPLTGRGLADNPFYNGNANANRSKVYQYGVRNPFRISLNPDSGQLYIGDVGWTQWEEINAAPAGANFGWPWYEGASGTNAETRNYRDLPEAQAFYNSGQVATPAIYALNHAQTGINAIVLGDVYSGDAWPAEYQGDLFFNDLGQGIVRNISFDAQGNFESVETFTTGARIVVQMVTGPDGNMYFVDLNDGTVGRWVFTESGGANAAGEKVINAPITYPSPSANADGITVAVIDSGVKLSHPALSNSLWTNEDEVPGDGIDNDNNGFVDDVHGFNFDKGWASNHDATGHGTLIAGLIGGDGDGYRGWAPGADVMALRVLGADGNGEASDVARAIRYAVNNGADVINVSVDVSMTSEVAAAVGLANDFGVLIVVAAGNGGKSTPGGLASLSGHFGNVLSVGAVAEGALLPDSNRVGDSGAVQIDAPGVAFGTLWSNGYGTFQGTSVAAALTSATAALVLAANPELDAPQLRELLVSTASPVASGSDSIGTLDAAEAIDRSLVLSGVSVSRNGSVVTVQTTTGDDEVVYALGELTIEINGVTWHLGNEPFDRVAVRGVGGHDRITVYGTGQAESGLIRDDRAFLAGGRVTAIAHQFDRVRFFGCGGDDLLSIINPAGDHAVTADEVGVEMESSGVYRGGFGFPRAFVFDGDGGDSAFLQGSHDADRLVATPGRVRLKTASAVIQVNGFETVDASMRGGEDVAVMRGDAQSQSGSAMGPQATLLGEDFAVFVIQVERTKFNGFGGDDSFTFYDRDTRDRVTSLPGFTHQIGNGYNHRAYQFRETTIRSRGGLDSVSIFGSSGDDDVTATPRSTHVEAGGFSTTAIGFENVTVNGLQGVDSINLTGSNLADQLVTSDLVTRLSGIGFEISARAFETIRVDSQGGDDEASIHEGAGSALLELYSQHVELEKENTSLTLDGFSSIRAYSTTDNGNDVVRQIDSRLDYVFSTFGDWSTG